MTFIDIVLVFELLQSSFVSHSTSSTLPLLHVIIRLSRHPEGCRQLTEAGARVIPASSRSPASAPASEQEDGVSMASRAGHEGLAVYLLNVAVAQASHERHKTPPSTDVSSDRVLYPLANAQDGDGFTRAMNAAYRGQTRLVKLLIAAGTDVNIEVNYAEDNSITLLSLYYERMNE